MSRRGIDSKWWTLAVACVATFMLLLDVTVVNLALPQIQDNIGGGFTDLQWIVDAYSLALAALLLIAGSLADRFGRRLIFVGGLVLFTVASLGSGFAGSPLVLDSARALQGIGGAGMLTSSLALIAVAFEGRERGVAFAVWGAVSGAAIAVGPLVGGAVIELLSWHWIFFLNAPIAIGVAAVTLARVAESRNPAARRIDWAGGATLIASLTALVFVLLRGNIEGWGSALIVGLLVASAVLMALFVAIEALVAEPVLDLGLFRTRTTVGAAIGVFALGFSVFSMLIFLSIYLQNIQHFGPLAAGLRLLPITLAAFLAAALTGHAAERVSMRGLLGVGLALCGVGLLLMRGISVGSDWTALLAGFVVSGIGIGLVNPTVARAALGTVEDARSGMASGLNNTFRLMGVATGVGALGAIFQHSIGVRLAASAPDLPGQAALAVASGHTAAIAGAAPPAARPGIAGAAAAAFVSSLDRIMLIAAIVSFAGALVAAILVRRSDLVSATPEPAHEDPASEPLALSPDR